MAKSWLVLVGGSWPGSDSSLPGAHLIILASQEPGWDGSRTCW